MERFDRSIIQADPRRRFLNVVFISNIIVNEHIAIINNINNIRCCCCRSRFTSRFSFACFSLSLFFFLFFSRAELSCFSASLYVSSVLHRNTNRNVVQDTLGFSTHSPGQRRSSERFYERSHRNCSRKRSPFIFQNSRHFPFAV